eukprot:10862287-Alexandrium_andersonii.AAC.1
MPAPSLLLWSSRRSPWPSSGQRGSACAASARCTRSRARPARAGVQLHVRTSAVQNVDFRAPES